MTAATPVADPAKTAFQQARDNAAAKALPAGSYMSGEEKAAMFDSGQPFWLVDCQTREDAQYGPRASFVVVLDPATAPNGEYTAETSRTIDLGLSAFRGELVKELKAMLDSSKIIGPLYLTKFKTTNNKDAWDITDVPSTDKVPY